MSHELLVSGLHLGGFPPSAAANGVGGNSNTTTMGGGNDNSVANERRKEMEIDYFCRKTRDSISIKREGYVFISDIAKDIYDDYAIDPYKKAIELGFVSLEAFLHSAQMKAYINLEDAEGIYSYHAIIPQEQKNQYLNAIRTDQRVSFLEMEKRRDHRNRAYRSTNDLTADQLLRQRMLKRDASGSLPPPERVSESVPTPKPKPNCLLKHLVCLSEAGADFEEIGADDTCPTTANIVWKRELPEDAGEEEDIAFADPPMLGGPTEAEECRDDGGDDDGLGMCDGGNGKHKKGKQYNCSSSNYNCTKKTAGKQKKIDGGTSSAACGASTSSMSTTLNSTYSLYDVVDEADSLQMLYRNWGSAAAAKKTKQKQKK